ncbi:hypothetical protein [Stenomitos frigidus]|uniref:hypothetical protein n=1 Tax=Stenomitos frigidus TaxID=1886765 RepID=UPI0015E6E69A|nr:hypothetical protein [Stenomitos frigidus]
MSRQLHPVWLLAYLLCILAIVAVGSMAIAHAQKSIKLVPASPRAEFDAGT